MNWRYVEVTSILLGSVAILSAGLQLGRWVAENHLEFAKVRVHNHLSLFRDNISLMGKWIQKDLDYLGGDPSKMLERQDYSAALAWVQAIEAKAMEATTNGYEKFNPSEIVSTLSPSCGALIGAKRNLASLAESYDEVRNEYTRHQSGSRMGKLEQALLALSPFMFSIAAGLSLTKAVFQ
ncbi:MAG: hypothetical protein ACT6U0_08380 [Shinella sp.]